MSQLDVRIIDLPPMRVASATAFSSSPETEAWKKLETWASARGLLNQPGHRIFGFDNPSPTTGSPNYGYEFWITVSSEVQPEGEIKIKEFKGGRYAVAHCKVNDPWQDIPGTWQKLVTWAEEGAYHISSHQCLEEHFTMSEHPENFELDLYLPIA
jgi:DNA gyrase inhibitor GyrI